MSLTTGWPPVYVVDTSALAKRYVAETGSVWVRATLSPGTGARVFLARITAVELIAALTRRERGGTLPADQANAARGAFRTALASEYQQVEVDEALIERAMALAQTHGLRGYDAVQLAAALRVATLASASGLPPITLLSADAELNAAARAEGLAVEDPGVHP